MKVAAIVISAAVVVQAASARAAENAPVVRVEPSSPWSIDLSDERCRLSREFGIRKKVRLEIDSYGSKDSYRFVVSGDLVPRSARPSVQLRIGFSPDAAERETFTGIPVNSGRGHGILFKGGVFPDYRTVDQTLFSSDPTPAQREALERIVTEFAAQTTSMTLRIAEGSVLRLNTENMAEPMASMHKCVDDLIASWGFDPDEQAALTRKPRLLPETVTRVQREFPRLLARLGLGAYVPVRVTVDENGQATRCFVQVPFDESIEETVCAGMLGAYEPALDADGKPVASFLQVTTIYQGPPPRQR